MSSVIKSLKIKKVLEYDYVGDGNADREIDLGDDYDYIQLWRNENVTIADVALGGFAFRSFYDYRQNSVSVGGTQTYHKAEASYWLGKMTGADKNKIKLGTGVSVGLNGSGVNYKIFAMKIRG